MKVKVKICGIRTLGQANVAINAGVDFLGFNFVPMSKRRIDVKDAEKIINKLHKKQKILIVGVFQNQSVDEVNEISELLNLDYVQLHGEEDEIYIKKIKNKIIKRIYLDSSPAERDQNDNVEYLLLDRNVQGQGEIVDTKKAKKLAKKYSIFFSGGLTPDNVGEIVSKVEPYAIDVAGGVETNGKPDFEKIKMFIKTVKEVNI